jgi:hypothetical protein
MPDDASDLERRVCDEILEIPVERYPPDYFTLLGITPATEDAALVELAAKQQSDRLRRGTPNELIPAARYVLKRIEKARICLSDTSSRKAYQDSVGKGQAIRSDRLQPHPNPAASSRTSSRVGPARPTAAGTTPPLATKSRSELSEGASASETSIANALDLSSLLKEFAEEEASANLIGLTNTPYKSKKSNRSQAILYGSVGAISAAILAIIGLLGYLASSDPAASQLPEPNQFATQPADDPGADVPPASIVQPNDTDQHVASSALSSGAIEPMPSALGTESQDSIPADSGTALIESQSTGLASVGDAIDTANSPAVMVASVTPNSQETKTPQVDVPDVPIGSLEGLVTEIDLPPLRVDHSAATTEVAGTISDLGYLDEEAASNLQIAVDEPKSKQFVHSQFYVQQPDEGVPAWEIRLKAAPAPAPRKDAEAKGKIAAEKSQLDGAVEGFDEVIASMRFESSGLRFRWGQTKRATLVEQLRNCALVLTSNGLSHRIQLRPELLTYKFMFDLSKSNHIFEIAEEHLPQADTIRFKITNVQLPGLAFVLEPANGIIGKGNTLRIKTLDGGIPVEFQFVLSVTASKATVKFVPRHQLGRRWYPFTGGQVHGAIDDLERALADGRGRFSAAQSAMSSLPGQLSSIESRLRADSPDYARIQSQRTFLMRQLSSARGTARRLSKSIPEMESKLPQLNSLVALGKRIHLQGRLEFRAYIPLGEGELVLLKTGTEEPPTKEGKAKE